ncbi:MAG TPA: hypothetical protein VGO93_15760 [Candidatus Xenobia bacterium]
MKMEAGEDPNHTASHPTCSYPGAVYYYATQPYRVYRVSTHARTVHV